MLLFNVSILFHWNVKPKKAWTDRQIDRQTDMQTDTAMCQGSCSCSEVLFLWCEVYTIDHTGVV